ncbi:hybrid sensor histidine kinase/response regulator transcription factor [uncultured Bacteroides sp.]|uniref:hybrid sensor histidine kinase/response regulator transcription factor n=1 Tax=uncultured Bacteroides sp. TaxID=162156 RepID=UPI002601199F|nr:hybrid sensor histidine kinase/response regulator transcription factor [uncultured Bacteroides sp.]
MKEHLTDIFKHFVILLFLAVSSSIHARHFKVLDLSNGLSNNTVKCITQDEQGFIWLGTFDGLCRFDGVNFSVFRNDPDDNMSIVDNHVEAIQADDDGLWIGTQKGVNFYSYREHAFYPCYQLLPTGEKRIIKNAINRIIRIGNKVYVLNLQRELSLLVGPRTFKACNYDNSTSCLSMAVYKGELLLVQTKSGLLLVDPKKETVISRLDFDWGDSDDNVLFYSKNSGVVYVGAGIGHSSRTFRINESLEFEETDAPAPSDLKTVIDCGEDTYFGTDGNGLFALNSDRMAHFTPLNSDISSDAIHSLFADRDDNLWIGTYRGGLNLSSARYEWFKFLTVSDRHLTQGVVTAVFSMKDKLYVGLDGGGLNIYDTTTGKTSVYTTANSDIAGNHILSVCGDSQYIWLGIYGKGLCRYSPLSHTFKTFTLPSVNMQNNSNRIWKIEDDNRGCLWIIGENICLFNKTTETFTFINELNGVGGSGIRFDENSVWISTTSNGIYRLDRMTRSVLKHYCKESETTSIAANSIRYIYLDSKHHLWFATEYSGVYKLDETSNTVTLYGAANGLTERNIVSIQEDDSGFYWFGTGNGLFRYDAGNETFVRFGREDNLPFMQFNYNACSAQDGRLYFGAVGGLVWFEPDDIRYETESNHVYFTGLELLNKDKKRIPLYGENPEEIRLPHDRNFFTLHFSTPELISSGKVKFSCYMDNFEQSWQNISHDRKITYTNVPPGKYHFYVRASGNDGRWSKHVSCLQIVITPPWWKTGWALCLWGVMILGIVFLVFWLYRHELDIKHMVSLKELEKNTAKTINEAKLNFFTNITHELRTPVFLITAPLEELLASGRTPVQVPKSYLTAMYRNAMRLNKLISRIIDFRKLESGKLKLELQRQNVVAFCKDLTVDYEALCLQKEIMFYFQPSKAVISLDFDPGKLESILSNLVSNAFKYTPEGGRIIFSIDEVGSTVVFTVEDNGIGIGKEYHEAIFDSFFQVEPSRTSAVGDGIGLSFVKHLVELHGGTVKVESTPEQGSKFIFGIPKLDVEEQEMTVPSSIIVDEAIAEQPLGRDAVSVQSPATAHSVLIIDDEKETVEILERFLIEDFKILKAGNGLDGLAIVQESLPDIIICDIMMPKMDGTEFLSIVKSDKKLSHIPVIMFTAKTSEEDKMAAFDSGADAYLTKPISLRYLRKRIDHLLARAESVEMANMIFKNEKKYTKEEQRFLLKCKEVIDDNLTNGNFDVMFLADQLGMSHSSLYRKIKAVTGMSVIEFINEYRIFKAVQCFKEGETNISTVCVKCGFNDLKNFRDSFKRKMKVSPKQYISQL